MSSARMEISVAELKDSEEAVEVLVRGLGGEGGEGGGLALELCAGGKFRGERDRRTR